MLKYKFAIIGFIVSVILAFNQTLQNAGVPGFLYSSVFYWYSFIEVILIIAAAIIGFFLDKLFSRMSVRSYIVSHLGLLFSLLYVIPIGGTFLSSIGCRGEECWGAAIAYFGLYPWTSYI